MRLALVKFGEVSREVKTGVLGLGATYEGGIHYADDFLRVTNGHERLLLSLGRFDERVSAPSMEAVSIRVSDRGGSLRRFVALLGGLRTLRRRLFSFRPDMIVCLDTGLPALACIRVARSTRASMIVCATTDLSGSGVGRWLRSKVAARVLGSDYVRDTLAVSSVVAQQVDVLRPLGRTRVFQPEFRDVCELPRPLPACERDNSVLFVGRLVGVKGIDWLLRISQRVVKGTPNRFVVVGDGPERSRLERDLAPLIATEKVALLGLRSRSETLELMRRAKLVVVPSRAEGLGQVAMESAYVGTPVVAFRAGGLSDGVIDGQTGSLITAGDVDAFAEEIVRLLTDQSAYSKRLESLEAARAELLTRWPTFGEALGELLADLV